MGEGGPFFTHDVNGETIELWYSGAACPPDRAVGPASSSTWMRAAGLWWPLRLASGHKAIETLECCEHFVDVAETLMGGWPWPPVEKP